MTNIEFVKTCLSERKFRAQGFRQALIAMRFDDFTKKDTEFFTDIYFSIKGDADRTADRGLVLEAIVLRCLKYELKDFFLKVFNSERVYSTRLTAIRGYSSYATESEIAPLVDKLVSTLHKGNMTNVLYIQYERLRSKFGIPYLIKQYGYDCFREAMKRLDELYDSLHNDLKGYFTLDENGLYFKLLSDEETRTRFARYMGGLQTL